MAGKPSTVSTPGAWFGKALSGIFGIATLVVAAVGALLKEPPNNFLGHTLWFLWAEVPVWTYCFPFLAVMAVVYLWEKLRVHWEPASLPVEAIKEARETIGLQRDMHQATKEAYQAKEATWGEQKEQLSRDLADWAEQYAALTIENNSLGETATRLQRRQEVMWPFHEIMRRRSYVAAVEVLSMIRPVVRRQVEICALLGIPSEACRDAYEAAHENRPEPEHPMLAMAYLCSHVLQRTVNVSVTLAAIAQTPKVLEEAHGKWPDLNSDELAEKALAALTPEAMLGSILKDAGYTDADEELAEASAMMDPGEETDEKPG